MAKDTIALSQLGDKIRSTLYAQPDTNPFTDHFKSKLKGISDGATKVESTDDLSEGSNLFFTQERVNDRVKSLLKGGANVTLDYDDPNGQLTINASQPIVPVDSVVGKTGAVSLDTDDVDEGNRLYFTNERVDDRVADLLVPGTNISISYDDANGKLRIDSSDGSGGDVSMSDTDDLAEGTKNLYYTKERVDDRVSNLLSGGNNITLNYDDGNGVLTIDSVDVPINSVNGMTGDVVVSFANLYVKWMPISSGFTPGDSDNGMVFIMSSASEETIALDDSPSASIWFEVWQETGNTINFSGTNAVTVKPLGASLTLKNGVARCRYDCGNKVWRVDGDLDSKLSGDATTNTNIANVVYDDNGTLENVTYLLVQGGNPANLVYQIDLN